MDPAITKYGATPYYSRQHNHLMLPYGAQWDPMAGSGNPVYSFGQEANNGGCGFWVVVTAITVGFMGGLHMGYQGERRRLYRTLGLTD